MEKSDLYIKNVFHSFSLQAVVDENGNCPLSKVQKNFICDHCYGAFRSGYHLKRHILIHTGMNITDLGRCKYCTYLFMLDFGDMPVCSVVFLTGEKPFACAVCDMRFIQRYHLERHSLTHTGTTSSAMHLTCVLTCYLQHW